MHYPDWGSAKELDFTFIGTAFHSRGQFFNAMSFDGLRVSLGGNGWEMLAPEHRRLYDYLGHRPDQCVDNDETARIYRMAKTGINFYRREGEDEHKGEGWSMGPREVEMAACGLFFVRDPRPESDDTFGDILPSFSSPQEAEELLRWFITHDGGREDAARKAHAAIQHWTFDNRAKDACILMERIGILCGICKPCRTAGNFQAALDYSPPTGSDLGNVLELYAKCKGGTWCDSQKKVKNA